MTRALSPTDERIAAVRKSWWRPPALWPVLLKAREDRQTDTPSSPSALYYLADASADLYFHAMIERGYVLGPDKKPYAVCPICDYDFEAAVA